MNFFGLSLLSLLFSIHAQAGVCDRYSSKLNEQNNPSFFNPNSSFRVVECQDEAQDLAGCMIVGTFQASEDKEQIGLYSYIENLKDPKVMDDSSVLFSKNSQNISVNFLGLGVNEKSGRGYSKDGTYHGSSRSGITYGRFSKEMKKYYKSRDYSHETVIGDCKELLWKKNPL
ncbi:MAG: hypothetical protein ACOYL6_15960 [Bacteriovoracaceae bacterium]